MPNLRYGHTVVQEGPGGLNLLNFHSPRHPRAMSHCTRPNLQSRLGCGILDLQLATRNVLLFASHQEAPNATCRIQLAACRRMLWVETRNFGRLRVEILVRPSLIFSTCRFQLRDCSCLLAGFSVAGLTCSFAGRRLQDVAGILVGLMDLAGLAVKNPVQNLGSCSDRKRKETATEAPIGLTCTKH
jgi:hypothetical protein